MSLMSAGVAQEGLKVLVVDDYDDGRLLLKQLLESKGFRVTETSNGEEAVESVRRECPDLILMDLNKPRMDGLTAARKIRECRELCRDVPMVAVTAYHTYGMKEAAEEAGCDAYVAKPIDQAQFERTLRRLLPAWH
jgi:two-component system, cell cycle response regulator DivK